MSIRLRNLIPAHIRYNSEQESADEFWIVRLDLTQDRVYYLETWQVRDVLEGPPIAAYSVDTNEIFGWMEREAWEVLDRKLRTPREIRYVH